MEPRWPDMTALSHEVGELLRTEPTGDDTKFTAMELNERLLQASWWFGSHGDDVMVETVRSWITRVQNKHVHFLKEEEDG